MLGRRLLLIVFLCLPAAMLCRPADTTNIEIREETEVDDTPNMEADTLDKRFRSPKQYRSRRQATDVPQPITAIPNENDIPVGTRNKFVPPTPRSKGERDRINFPNYRPEIPPHAYVLVKNEPYFGTLDHAKLIMELEQLRKQQNLPVHRLKSLRPFFPFFSIN